jgi:hypothetical protein
MIRILGRGVSIGPLTGSQILNYSNSSLKNHSVWMLVNTDIAEIKYNEIIKRLGKFNLNDAPLKMYARRG